MQAQLDIGKVVKVYSGKAHTCMCGCSGKWTYATASERSVKIITGKIAKNGDSQYDAQAKCYHVTVGKRILAAYFE